MMNILDLYKMKKYLISAIFALVFFTACSKETLIEDPLVSQEEHADNRSDMLRPNALDGLVTPGILYVKMDAETAESLKNNGGDIDIHTFSAVSSDIELAAKRVGVTNVERVFPTDPRFEERHKRYGLDRWYVVTYEENKDVATAMRTFSTLKEFEVVEPAYEVELENYTITPVIPSTLNGMKPLEATDLPFNDPRLGLQWHYNNDGSAPGAVAGADINLFEAWKIETGKPNVIVAVIDDGVDYKHEDLVENLWVNKKPNLPIKQENFYGAYIEDLHGANFVENGRRGNHGTHVAGTVAARNNNNIGVAGGDGNPNTGVRIMACLAIDTRPKGQRTGSHPERAFVFAADNGAVIAQNSWGYAPNVEMGQILKDAIDYFIDNAGTDSSGHQLPGSPMKGGVVIFSTGNDNFDGLSYPAAYERVVSVAAMGPNFYRSSFTNRGPWVDITAPGGDIDMYGNNAGILSCIPDNSYGFYQGTSMACPHVSGIAALVVSKNGGQGYTNEDLKRSLLTALRPQDIDAFNPREAGRLGRGYIDAAKAFAKDHHIAPDRPEIDPEMESEYSTISFSWVVNKDDDDILPTYQHLYISDKPITKEKLSSLTSIQMRATVTQPGEEMEYTFTGLKHSTKYYIAVVSEDRWGNLSEPDIVESNTRMNQVPIITFSNMPKEIVIFGRNSLSLDFSTSDPDGHKVSCELQGETTGVSIIHENGKGQIQIRPVLKNGRYTFQLLAKDEFGGLTTKSITFKIEEQIPIQLKGDFSQLLIGQNEEEFLLPLKSNYDFNRHIGIDFEVRSSDESIIKAAVFIEGMLSIIPVKPGVATVYIKATDKAGGMHQTSFKVRVVKDSEAAVHIVYPMPVKNTLNLIINKSVKDPRVKVVTMNGRVLIDESIKSVGKDGHISLDVSNLSQNTYRLILESSNMSRYEQVFVK